MIPFNSERDETRVLDALTSGEAFPVRTLLFIGDPEKAQEDYTDKLQNCEWGQSEIPITLSETKLGSVLPRRLEHAPVYLYAEVEGVRIPQMVGRYDDSQMAEDRSSTEFISSSGGALLPRVSLREPTDNLYNGVPPEFIIRDALDRVARVGGYERGLISVQVVGSPTLYFVGEEGFGTGEKAGDVLDRVIEQVPYVVRDTAHGGVIAELSLALGREDEVSYIFRASDIPTWVPPKRSEEQYSEVEVFREASDGSDLYRQRAEIVYRGLDYAPFADTPMLIPLNDDSDEGPQKAQELANELAEARSRGIYMNPDTELVLPVFWPILAKGDLLRVDETHADDDGLWDRAWHLRVDSFKQTKSGDSNNPTLVTSIDAYTAVLVEEDRIKVPSFIGTGLSTGILEPIVEAPYGIDGDDLFFSEGLSWVYIDGDDLVFTTDAPASIDGDDLVITDAGL